MIRRPPGSTRTDTLFPSTTLFRSGVVAGDAGLRFGDGGDLFSQLPADDSAVILLSGSDPAMVDAAMTHAAHGARSEEHTSELQSLMRISYAVFCLKKKTQK